MRKQGNIAQSNEKYKFPETNSKEEKSTNFFTNNSK